MKITQAVYEELVNNSPLVPPEIGGILGGVDEIVTDYFYDNGMPSNDYDEYIPNVNFLNCKIKEWDSYNISFVGMFHTHFPNGYDLSNCDRQYIEKIMKNISLKKLYFPIVIPKERIIAYYAEKTNDEIVISQEVIRINNGECK